MNTHTNIKRLTITSAFIALTYIFTAFIRIPLLGGEGYFNLGDVTIILSSIYLGPISGMIVAISASIMADLTAGAASFIPFTIIAKGGEALIVGLLFKKFPDKFRVLSIFIATLFIVPVYMISYYLYFGVGYLMSSVFDLLQATTATILSYVLYLTFEKTNISKYLKINN